MHVNRSLSVSECVFIKMCCKYSKSDVWPASTVTDQRFAVAPEPLFPVIKAKKLLLVSDPFKQLDTFLY